MTEKPHFPHTSEIQLLLDGRMTAIVRPSKCMPLDDQDVPGFLDGVEKFPECSPFGPLGTILWCKERWWSDWKDDAETEVRYAYEQGYGEIGVEWKPAITMPKSACRLWLEVLEVKVCRVSEVTEEMAARIVERDGGDEEWRFFKGYPDNEFQSMRAIDSFEEWLCWRFPDLNSDSDPWIWYASIRRIEKP